jgi:transposase
MGSRRRYSREFKVEAVKLVLDGGVSVAQAARDLGVAENLLHTWKRKYREDPTFGRASRLTPDQEEIRRLRRELKRARQDQEILKKAAAYFAKESQ